MYTIEIYNSTSVPSSQSLSPKYSENVLMVAFAFLMNSSFMDSYRHAQINYNNIHKQKIGETRVLTQAWNFSESSLQFHLKACSVVIKVYTNI